MTPTPPVDERAYTAVQDLVRATPWLHEPFVVFAQYGVVVFGLLLLGALFHARRGTDRDLAAAGWAGLGTLLAVAVNQPLGAMVGEARPYATHPGAILLVPPTTDFSFPSDHAVMAGAAAVGVLLASRRWGRVAVAAGLLMAFARVYVGAHYPQDVVAGLAVGALVAGLGWVVLRPLLVAVTHHLRDAPLVGAVFGTS